MSPEQRPGKSPAHERWRIVARGQVQGVCFRIYTCEEAERLGVTGWVRNRSDGNVEIVAEGGTEALDALLAWARRGPPAARVTDVSVERLPASGEFEGFRVAY